MRMMMMIKMTMMMMIQRTMMMKVIRRMGKTVKMGDSKSIVLHLRRYHLPKRPLVLLPLLPLWLSPSDHSPTLLQQQMLWRLGRPMVSPSGKPESRSAAARIRGQKMPWREGGVEVVKNARRRRRRRRRRKKRRRRRWRMKSRSRRLFSDGGTSS